MLLHLFSVGPNWCKLSQHWYTYFTVRKSSSHYYPSHKHVPPSQQVGRPVLTWNLFTRRHAGTHDGRAPPTIAITLRYGVAHDVTAKTPSWLVIINIVLWMRGNWQCLL